MVTAGAFLTSPVANRSCARILLRSHRPRKGLLVICSGGTLLSDEILRWSTSAFQYRYFHLRRHRTGVSGWSPPPGSFARCYGRIDRVWEAGLPVTLKTR